MFCQKCGNELGQHATYCPCGWRARTTNPFAEERNQLVHCAHETCNQPSICKIKTKTGWANMCEFHYSEHFRKQAIENTAHLNLKTSADYRKWIRDNFPTMRAFEIEREPGADENFVYKSNT